MSPMVKKSEMYKNITVMHAKIDAIMKLQKEILDALKPGKTAAGTAPPVKERKVSKGRRSKKDKTP